MTLRVLTTLCLLMGVFYNQLLSQDHFEVSRLPFNTRSKELAPAFFGRGLVFCSDKRNDVLVSRTDQHNNVFTSLYEVEQKKPGKFESPKLLSGGLNTLLNDGPACFSQDYKTIYFTRSIDISTNLRSQNRPDTTFGIFSAEWVNGAWTNLTQFDFNSTAYKTGYPFLSDDGQWLFFASDAPGGFGGFDLYVAGRVNGRWSKPENLGPLVNTPENEVFPFLHANGLLYFSSRGHNQQKDLDIYYTAKLNEVWQKPVPMPEPFNTRNNDYGLILNASADTAYFVSDRAGSADIFAAWSALPTFTSCPDQKENDYCYVFYEPGDGDIDTTTFAYEWDLGDGTVIRALEAEHCFARPDTYIVRLNLVDKLTSEVLLNQATYEFVAAQIEQPYISGPDTVMAGEEILLNAGQTYLPSLDVQNYYWDFGDGSRNSGIETKHKYAFPGNYHIILGITGNGGSGSDTPSKSCVKRRIVVLDPKK